MGSLMKLNKTAVLVVLSVVFNLHATEINDKNSQSGAMEKYALPYQFKSEKRITEVLPFNTHDVNINYFSNQSNSTFQIKNGSPHFVKFMTETGSIAQINPGSDFNIPCQLNQSTGIVSIAQTSEYTAINEKALCGDIITITVKQEIQ